MQLQKFWRKWFSDYASPIRIFVYGTHTPDWMNALAPDASVWSGLLGSRKVAVEHINVGCTPSVAADEVAVILPLMEDHIAACLRSRLDRSVGLLPSAHALEILRNKAKFAEYLLAEHLTHFAPEIYSGADSAIFPCVLKRTDLHAGRGVSIAKSIQHLCELLSEDLWRNEPYLLQSFIDERLDYVTHCVCLTGRILWHRSFKYDLRESAIRGPWCKPELTKTTDLQLAAIEALLKPLSYSGPCNVDYKIADGHRIMVLEINPRLGGSLMIPENLPYLREALACIVKTALNQTQRLRKQGLIQ